MLFGCFHQFTGVLSHHLFFSQERLTAEEALEHPWMKGDTATRAPLDHAVMGALKNFNASCKFKQVILKHVADNMSEDQVAVLKETFAKLDKNKDGCGVGFLSPLGKVRF